MSAIEVTSEVKPLYIDGSDSQFRTITTAENGDIQKTVIQQSVSEEDYNKLDSDLQGGSSDGVFYQNIRTDIKDGDTFSNSYTSVASDEVQEYLNDPSNNFKKDLDLNSIDAILEVDPSISEQSLYLQYPSLENVAFTADTDDVTTLFGNTTVGDGFAAIDPQATLESFEIAATDRQTTYENLYYPYDIANSKQDRVVFKMFYHTGRDLNVDLQNSQGSIFEFGERIKKTIEGSVTLPIQGGIQDENQVDFSGATLNPVQGAFAALSLDPLQIAGQIKNVLDADVKDIQSALGGQVASNVINALKVYLAQSAVGASGLIPRTTGAILNPNLELLLKTPNLRSFNFAFKMSARSETEATQIRKIIRFFKQGMSVKRSESSLFIVSPNMFEIKYLTDENIQHPSIGRIKNCALTKLNTNYTPDGTYMTFKDEARTMTSYTINMQFTELEPLTETDYITYPEGDDPISHNDSQIGY